MDSLAHPVKRCPKCQETKPVDEFYFKDKAKGTRLSWCKRCMAQSSSDRARGNPERNRAYARDSYWRDPEKARQRRAEWYQRNLQSARERERQYRASHKEQRAAYRAANAQRRQAYNAEYRAAHADEIKARNATYRATRREELGERQRRWRQDHPERVAEIARTSKVKHHERVRTYNHHYQRLHANRYAERWHARRARLKGNGGLHTEAEWAALKATHGYCCLRCRQAEPDIRLTRDHVVPIVAGGTNDIGNIQPLCQSCNSRKSRRHLDFRIH